MKCRCTWSGTPAGPLRPCHCGALGRRRAPRCRLLQSWALSPPSGRSWSRPCRANPGKPAGPGSGSRNRGSRCSRQPGSSGPGNGKRHISGRPRVGEAAPAGIQGRVLLLTICAAGIGGTFQFGYNLTIINAPTLHIQEFINATWQARTGQPLPAHLVLLVWALIVSLYPVGGLLGALLAGPLAIVLGRKKSLLVNNIFVVAAAVLFGFSCRAGSFEMIMLGRLLMGVTAGVSMSVQPMYLGESAPKELRGAVAMTSAVFTALGIVMGQVVGLRELLGSPQDWPLLLASCLVPGALQLTSLPLLPESPRYLFIDRGDAEACLAALQRLRGTADVAAELAELQEERAACRGQRARRPWELFRDPALRRQVASLVVLSSAMELCGNDAVRPVPTPGAGAAGGRSHGGWRGSAPEPSAAAPSRCTPTPRPCSAWRESPRTRSRTPSSALAAARCSPRWSAGPVPAGSRAAGAKGGGPSSPSPPASPARGPPRRAPPPGCPTWPWPASLPSSSALASAPPE
nr:solute carrier family 2, facilitated glucose transporter member 11 isoform X4 [Manis javanica]